MPEAKGKPARVNIYPYPNASGKPIAAKSFFKAQEVDIRWSPAGLAVLIFTHTDVDATGGSYYGGTGLYLMQAHAKKAGEAAFECLVPLPKEGPIAAAEWEPTQGREFVVIAGTIPPVAALYNLEAEQVSSQGGKRVRTSQLQTAPISVVSQSCRLIFRRVIISWNGLEA